jgi:hypothetical protein
MVHFFSLLDRAFDTLAHAFDKAHAPATSRSRPESALFLVALALVPLGVLLTWEGGPWQLAVWGLVVVLVCGGLFAIWSR